VRWHVLAPHDHRSGTRDRVEHDAYVEHRFHYFWPRRGEELAGRGIMPALAARPALYAVLPFLVLAEAVALYRLARRIQPTTIYAHWFTPQGVVAAWVARATGARFVFTTHASDVAVWRKIPFVGPAVVRHHAARADRITAVSTRSLARLRQFFGDDAWGRLEPRTSIIPMGVHVDPTDAVAERRRTIVFVGRLAEKKGVQVLLDAVASATTELAGWELVVAGDGPWRARLEAQAQALGLDVSFPGYVTGEAKSDLITTAGVFVVPSIIADDGDAEGLPVALLEGLAAGRVCVATNESGSDDILQEGVNGFLVPERDVPRLADALVRATRLADDEIELISEGAVKCASALAWPIVARRYLDILLEES